MDRPGADGPAEAGTAGTTAMTEVAERSEATAMAESLGAMVKRSTSLTEAVRSKLPPMRGSGELAWLHQNWQLPVSFEQAGHPLTLTGARHWVRRRIARVAFSYVQRYLSENQDVVSHMVRLQEALATRCDALADIQERHYREVRAELDEVSLHLRLMGDAPSREDGEPLRTGDGPAAARDEDLLGDVGAPRRAASDG